MSDEGTRKTVPLVIYTRGERQVVGEATVEIGPGPHIDQIDATVVETKFAPGKEHLGKELLGPPAGSFSIGFGRGEVFEIAAIPPLRIKE